MELHTSIDTNLNITIFYTYHPETEDYNASVELHTVEIMVDGKPVNIKSLLPESSIDALLEEAFADAEG